MAKMLFSVFRKCKTLGLRRWLRPFLDFCQYQLIFQDQDFHKCFKEDQEQSDQDKIKTKPFCEAIVLQIFGTKIYWYNRKIDYLDICLPDGSDKYPD